MPAQPAWVRSCCCRESLSSAPGAGAFYPGPGRGFWNVVGTIELIPCAETSRNTVVSLAAPAFRIQHGGGGYDSLERADRCPQGQELGRTMMLSN